MTSVRPRRHELDDVDGNDDVGVAAPAVGSWRPWIAFALSVLGFGDSMYLTIDHFTGALPVCSSKGFVDCQLVTTSQYSYLFHIPVSLLGLIFYTLLVGINVPRLWRSSPVWLAWARLVLVTGGMGFVLYLLARELISLGAICLWCTGVHVVTFLLFVVVITAMPAMTGRARSWGEWDDDEADDDADPGDVALGPA